MKRFFFLCLVLLVFLGAKQKEKKQASPAKLHGVLWVKLIPSDTMPLSIKLDWIAPKTYRHLTPQKKVWYEIWRKSQYGTYRKIAHLPLPQIQYRDTTVHAGGVYRYMIRTTDGRAFVDSSIPQIVYAPPRGVNPLTNGRLEIYNYRYLQKALEWKYIPSDSRRKYARMIPSLKEPLENVLVKDGLLSRYQWETLQKGKKVYSHKVKGKKVFYLDKNGKKTAKVLDGVGPPPRAPWVTIFKEKNSDEVMAQLKVQVHWVLSPDDDGGTGRVKQYIILRADKKGGKYKILGKVKRGAKAFKDLKAQAGKEYFYKISTWDGEMGTDVAVVNSETKSPSVVVSQFFFDTKKTFVFLTVLLFTLIFFYFVWEGKKGKKLKLRRIEGLNAIEEAIGRATEMGKPVLYVPGIDDIQELQTVASLVILSHVSETTALYETPIIVPCRDSVVMTMAEEVVHESAISAGRPDTFNADNIRYLSSDQFAYVAGVDGIMLREKPAANLYLGSFFAESLILAETGYESGAIQVAGTANYHQLPFFIVACDFTIIGEEFYAASAYLSKDAKIIGSIKAADYFKLIMIIFILIVVFGGGWFYFIGDLARWMLPH